MTSTNTNSSFLTRFEPASLREIMAISVPIMVSSLSGQLMNFFDRLILANHSMDAMNAAVIGGMTANVFTYGALGIALIAEVFVGKKNGAGDHANVAKPVWQMLWFSAATVLIFVPTAVFLTPLVVPIEEFSGQAGDYFRVWMFFGPVFPMVGALSAFFIGTGKVKIVTIVTIIGNALNILLDYLLVFGFFSFPPLGAKGAALATGISQLGQALILSLFFFSRANNKKYCTRNYTFDKKLFVACLKVGGPSTMGHMIEILAWSVMLRLMVMAGEAYITVLSIGQSLFILFAFVTDGLQKGVTAIAANLIGSKQKELMSKLILSAVCFFGIIMAVLFFPLALYPDPLVKIFLLNELNGSAEIYQFARLCGLWIWLYLFMDGMVWVFAGVLTAFSDTTFIMIANAGAAWAFCLLPTYLAINVFKAEPHYSWVIMNLYAFLNVSIFILRTKLVLEKKSWA